MAEDNACSRPDTGSIHWRAERGGQHRFDSEPLAELLFRALAGTALAGFAFPTVLLFLSICMGSFSVGQALAALAGGVMIVGICSALLAFTVCIPVTILAAFIGRLIGVTVRDVWFASLVGGWSAYFACQLTLGGAPGAKGIYPLVALAVATGQIGAGAYAYRGYRESRGADHSDEVRIGLRQLFGVMTAVAILASGARVLSEQGAFVTETAIMAVGIQAAIIGVAVGANAYLRHRRAAQAVSREAAARSA